MKLLKSLSFLLFIGLASTSFAQKFQGARIGAYAGLSSAVGSFAEKDNALGRSNGYAGVGLSAGAFGDLFLSKHVSVGIRGGYSIYEVADDDMLELVKEFKGDSVSLSTTPYQNLNLAGVLGYTFYAIEDKLDINPYVSVGLSIFKTSDKRFTQKDSLGFVIWDYHVKSEIDPSLQLAPGLAVNYSLMSFLDLRIFTEYVYSNHRVEENAITTYGSTDPSKVLRTRAVDYYLRALSFGGGLSLRF